MIASGPAAGTPGGPGTAGPRGARSGTAGPPALRGWPALALLGGLQMTALALLGWLPGARGTPFPAFLLWGAAWSAHALAWLRLERGRGRYPGPGRDADSGGQEAGAGPGGPGPRVGARAVLWAVGVGGRLLLLPLTPHFSDDIYRYLWDGRIALHGVNPYLHAPDAEALEPLRTAWHALVNHPEIPTIYPPGAQILFHLLALLGSSVLLYKAAWVVADLGVAWVVDRIARRRGLGATPLLLWLWSPLVLVEVAWSGHLEPLGILPMVAAVLLLARPGGRSAGKAAGPDSRRRGLLAGGFLGLGVSVKLAPALALPALARRRGPAAAALILLVPLLLYLPYSGAGARLFAGLGEYAARWEFNAGLFLPLEALFGPRGARLAGGGAAAAVALLAGLRRWPLDRALLWAMGAALLLSPTLHPWYLLWILPLAALARSRAWIVLTATVFLAYAGLDAYRATGHWPEPVALRLLVHLPFYLVLAAEAVARLRGASRFGLPSRPDPREGPEARGGRGQVAGGEEPGEEERRPGPGGEEP